MENTAVSVLSVVLCAVSGCIAFGLPIALLAVCRCRTGRGLGAAAVGAVCFVASALVLENLLHLLVFSVFPTLPYHPALYGLYGCLASGFFEETGRLVGLKLLCRRDSSAATGFAYGIGHGGIEAILLAGIAAVSNLVVLIQLRANAAQALVEAAGAQGAAVQAQMEALAAAPPINFLAAGVERIGAVALHIALSMLIWMVVTKRLPVWFYFVAVALHGLTNVSAVLYQTGYLQSIWLTEALMLAVVACICAFVRRLYLRRRAAPQPEAAA